MAVTCCDGGAGRRVMLAQPAKKASSRQAAAARRAKPALMRGTASCPRASSAGCASQGFTQRGFLGFVEGGAHDLTAHALQPVHHAIGGHFPYQQE